MSSYPSVNSSSLSSVAASLLSIASSDVDLSRFNSRFTVLHDSLLAIEPLENSANYEVKPRGDVWNGLPGEQVESPCPVWELGLSKMVQRVLDTGCVYGIIHQGERIHAPNEVIPPKREGILRPVSLVLTKGVLV